MRKRTGRGTGTRRERDLDAIAPFASELRSLTNEIRVQNGLLRKIANVVKAQQPSIAIRPYLREDFEREILKCFLQKSQRTTTELSAELRSYPKKCLRALKRINRRASKREGVDPFAFDPATRSWKLELEIVDRKELQSGFN